MKIIEDIREEVRKTESDFRTNIIVQFQDLEGKNFFEKIDGLRWALNVLQEENNLCLVEDNVVPKEYWAWDFPIYFDPKFKIIQFDLERMEQEPVVESPFTVECGSIWRRRDDGTVIEVQAIEDHLIYVKILEGPGFDSETVNLTDILKFWDKKS